MKDIAPIPQPDNWHDSQTIFAALRDALATLYSKESDARAVVYDAGLDTKQIAFSLDAQTNWHNILTEAISRQCLDKLLEVVLSAYSSNASLQTAYRQYRLFIEQDGHLEPAAQLPVGRNTLQIIETDGGTNVAGDINIGGGDFIGRDEIIHGDKVYGDKVIGAKSVHIHRGDDVYDVQGLPNPYLGLSSFSYEDRSCYAGREEVIRKTVELLTTPGEQRTLLFITGASGSGKSSFAQAGLLPALETYYTQRNQHIRWVVLRPSRQPLISFADGLLRLGIAVEGLSAELGKHTWEVLSGLDRANQIGLLIIDQFEEIFTQSIPVQRDKLCELLESLPEFAKLRVHIIAALRIDYLPQLFARKTLFDIAKQGIDLRAMSVDELQLAIQRPLQQAFPGGEKRFERALVEKLANESASDAAYLPLLQVTLEDLWRRGRLQLSAYGNLTDAIEQRAEHVYNYFDDATGRRTLRSDIERDTILKTFLNLVRVSLNNDDQHDVRRYRPEIELTQGKPEQEKLIEELVNSRLLSKNLETQPDSDEEITVVDIIHESLITNWSRLREAITDKRGVLQQRTRFEHSLNEWLSNGRNEQYLLEGIRLAEAESLAKHEDIIFRNADAQVLLNRSINRREKRRLRNQRLTLGVIASLIVMLAVAIGGWGIAMDAQQDVQIAATAEAVQRKEVEEKNKVLLARNLVAQARQVEFEDPLLALRLVLEARAWLPDSELDDRYLQEGLLRGYLTRGIIARYRNSSVPKAQYISPNLAFLDYSDENRYPSNTFEIRNALNGELINAPRGNLTVLPYRENSLARLLVNFDFPGLPYESTVVQLERYADEGPPIIPDIGEADYFVVQYRTLKGELRSKVDSSVIDTFPDAIDQIRIVPGATYFIVDFVAPKLDLVQERSELRNKADGSLLEKLPGKVSGIVTEKDRSIDEEPIPYFVLNYNDETSELRRIADGDMVAKLPGKLSEFKKVDETFFTLSYENGLHEVRRRDDGSLFIGELAKAVSTLYNISDEAPYFIVRYDDGSGELRRKSDGKFDRPLPYHIREIDFMGESSYFLINYANQPGEFRRKVDGTLVAQLGGVLSYNFTSFNPDRTSSYFLLDYEGETPGEILDVESGTIIELAGKIASVRGVNENAPYFILTYQTKQSQNGQSEYIQSELRRKDDGSRVELLAGAVSKIYPEQGFRPYFVLDYENAPGELRSSVDGALMAKLTGTIDAFFYATNNVNFQLTSNLLGEPLEYFILDYVDKSGELRNLADGTSIGPLKGEISEVFFSGGQESTFVLQYEDKPGELRKKADGSLFKTLTDTVSSVLWTSPYFVIHYKDAADELYRADGSLFKTLTDTVSSVLWAPPYFVIHYKDAADELYSSINSSYLLTLAKKVTEIRGVDSCLQVTFADGSTEALFPVEGKAFPIPQRFRSLENLSCLPGKTSYFMATQYNDQIEIVSGADSSVVQRFAGTGLELRLVQNSSSYFILDYQDAPDELRNAEDVSFVEMLKGDVSFVAPIGEAGTHFIIAYEGDIRGELRRSLDGGIEEYFPDVFAMYWSDYYLRDDQHNKLPFFVAKYMSAPDELRSQENGAIIKPLSDDTYWLRVLSHDRPYFLLLSRNNFAELYRKSDGFLLSQLPGKGEVQVVENLPPDAPYWIFDFEEAPGELRSVEDGLLLQTLNDDVDHIIRFGAGISYFILDYVNKPSELRNLTDGSFLLSLSGNISDVHQVENLYFLFDYADAKSELRQADDGSLVEQLEGNSSALWRIDGVSIQPLGSNIWTDQQGITPYFLIDYADAKSELRQADDGSLVEQLGGNVSALWHTDGVSIQPLGSNIWTDPQQGITPYFLIDYADAKSELRRAVDGLLLQQLDGRLSEVRRLQGGKYIGLYYEDTPSELRSVEDGALLQSLSGNVQEMHKVAGAPYFIVQYTDTPGELRSIEDGALIRQLNGRIDSVTVEMDSYHSSLTFLSNYFLVNYVDAQAELWLKNSGLLVQQLNGTVEQVYSSNRDIPFYVVDYADAPDELRSVVNHSVVAQLTYEAMWIDHMDGRENSEDKGSYFVLNYDNHEFSDLRRKRDGSLVGQVDKDFETITQRDPTDPYLLISYRDRQNELWSVADPSLITSAVEAYRDFAIGDTEYLLVKRDQVWEIWQAAPAKRLVALGTRSQEPPYSIYAAPKTQSIIQNKLFWDWHEGVVEIIDLNWLTTVGIDPQTLQDKQLLQAACVPFHVYRFNESILADEQYLGTLEPRACRSEFNGALTQFPIQSVSPLATSPLATPNFELGKQCALIIYVLDQETNEEIVGARVQITTSTTSITGKTRMDGDYRISNLCSDSDLSKIQVEATGYDPYTSNMPSLVGNHMEIWLSKSPPTPTATMTATVVPTATPTNTPTATLSGSE